MPDNATPRAQPPGPPGPAAAVPGSVRLAGAIVTVEGAALVVVAVVYAVLLVVGSPHNRGLALFGAAIGALFGAALVLAGRGLRRFRRAAYSPSLLIELIALPVGIGFVQGGQPLVAAAVLVPSAVVLVLLLLTPGGRAVISEGE